MDEHFRTAPFEDNIPVLLGLTGVWNTTFLGYPSMAILPYTQALSKLAPHIQQVWAEAPSIPVCQLRVFGEDACNAALLHKLHRMLPRYPTT